MCGAVEIAASARLASPVSRRTRDVSAIEHRKQMQRVPTPIRPDFPLRKSGLPATEENLVSSAICFFSTATAD